MVSAGEIVNESVLDAVACVPLVESVTVTVTELVPAAVGVPEITPVPLPIVSPEGSPLADHVYGPFPPVAAIVVE